MAWRRVAADALRCQDGAGCCGQGLSHWLAGAAALLHTTAPAAAEDGGALSLEGQQVLDETGPPGAPGAEPSEGLARALVVTDVAQLLGFCAPSSLARLRAAAPLFGRDDGLVGRDVMLRLVDAFVASRGQCRSLHEAADVGNLESAWAHMFCGASPDDYDVHGCVPLHYVADCGHTGICNLLLRAKADVHARHRGLNIRAGWAPLHFAAYSGARDVLLLLLLHGVEVNQMDGCRRTALYYALSRGRESCGRLITRFGGVAESHLIEASNLERDTDGTRLGRQDRALHQWDASADAADMFADSAGAQQFPDGNLSDRELESGATPLPRYFTAAGDTSPSLTFAAANMPGFEW